MTRDILGTLQATFSMRKLTRSVKCIHSMYLRVYSTYATARRQWRQKKSDLVQGGGDRSLIHIVPRALGERCLRMIGALYCSQLKCDPSNEGFL